MLGEYPDGVWLVELAPLADPALAPQAVATALGVRDQPGEPLLTTMNAALASRRVLLLLDNCEHLIDACARLADTLLRHCPHLRILATSREQLGVPGEVPYRVPSLALPDPATPLADISAVEAVRLFVARAQAARPGFALTAANAALVVQLCAQLDGIPLALELAAARLRALPLDQLAARLDDRFRLLTGGSRTALPRQQTLQATLDWSYRLLEEEECLLLRRLSVFAGGWTLEAAEVVCADAAIEAWRVLDLLTGLVDKSLVVPDELGTAPRYRLLETVRQYARERLGETGEGAAVRDRHRDWCLVLAEQSESLINTGVQWSWLRRMNAEEDNLRAALAWCEASDAASGLRLAARLVGYWYPRVRHTEGETWLRQFLARATAPTVERAAALGRLGQLLRLGARNLADAEAVLEEGLALGRLLAAPEPTLHVLWNLGLVRQLRYGPGAARALIEEALALSRVLGNRVSEGIALGALADGAFLGGDLARAQESQERVLALMREVAGGYQVGVRVWRLSEIACAAGDFGRALALAEELERLVQESPLPQLAIAIWMTRGEVAWARGEVVEAVAHGQLALRLAREAQLWALLARTCLDLARAFLATGNPAQARALLEDSHIAGEEYVGLVSYWLARVAWQEGERSAARDHLRAALRHHRDRGRMALRPR